MRAASALALLAIACGPASEKAPPAEPAPPEAPTTEAPPPEPSPPEIVTIPSTDPVPDDCTAEGPDGGLLDRTSTVFSRIEVKANKQLIIETATATDGSWQVTAQLGGCAHYGASYILEYTSELPVTDRAGHLRLGLEKLVALPTRDGVDNYIEGIKKGVDQVLADPKLLEGCTVPQGEMVNIYCNVSDGEDGRVSVAFAYDIVL